jgi:hypothetical protein
MTETVQFFLALGLMIGFAKAMGYLTYRLNQPAVLGELLAGLILGPTIIDLLGNAAWFPDGHGVQHTLVEMAEIGVLLLMFMAGMDSVWLSGRERYLHQHTSRFDEHEHKRSGDARVRCFTQKRRSDPTGGRARG